MKKIDDDCSRISSDSTILRDSRDNEDSIRSRSRPKRERDLIDRDSLDRVLSPHDLQRTSAGGTNQLTLNRSVSGMTSDLFKMYDNQSNKNFEEMMFEERSAKKKKGDDSLLDMNKWEAKAPAKDNEEPGELKLYH